MLFHQLSTRDFFLRRLLLLNHSRIKHDTRHSMTSTLPLHSIVMITSPNRINHLQRSLPPQQQQLAAVKTVAHRRPTRSDLLFSCYINYSSLEQQLPVPTSTPLAVAAPQRLPHQSQQSSARSSTSPTNKRAFHRPLEQLHPVPTSLSSSAAAYGRHSTSALALFSCYDNFTTVEQLHPVLTSSSTSAAVYGRHSNSALAFSRPPAAAAHRQQLLIVRRSQKITR